MTATRSHHPSTSVPVARLLLVTGALGLTAAAVGLVAPGVRVSFETARVVAVGWALFALLTTAWWAPGRGERRLPWFIGLLGLYLGLFSIELGGMPPLLLCVVTLAVLTTGGLVGGYIGSLLEYPGMLMVVAYVAACADCFSFFHPSGLTAQVLSNPHALALLTVPFPVLGSEHVASLVGIGDVTFVSLYVAGSRRTGLDPRRTVVALALAMAVVSVIVEVLGAPLPALPFLGASVVLAHPEARRLPLEQTRRVAANLVVVTILLGGLLLSAALRG